MTNSLASLNRIIIISMAIFFIAIIITSMAQRFIKPGLTVQNTEFIEQSNAQPDQMAAVGMLMEDVSKNPEDQKKILQLVEALLSLGQWQTAENFAQKALALDSPGKQNPKALYLLALAHHNKGEHEQAADLLERLLEQKEDPSARYSLGILYIYYLKKPDEGIKHLKKGVENIAEPGSLKTAMQEEIAKNEQKK